MIEGNLFIPRLKYDAIYLHRYIFIKFKELNY